jgi:NH3-dependent NAD+ synthetase
LVFSLTQRYDCSAADLNPIGGICKSDLRKFIAYSINKFHFEELREILEAPPTAELEPITETHTQTDEEDMGMSYDDLTEYGTVLVFGRNVSLEDAIEFHAFAPLEALPGM